ncbi:MAG: D-threo-aldose 1-dehydrogenase [Gammaproteobacteria bacterium]|jgi:D-threo-aldose 1-dehydrogenase|nr:D-threo-aldose 1-dehydrogenase [Gammaproteobacteria bacterium]
MASMTSRRDFLGAAAAGSTVAAGALIASRSLFAAPAAGEQSGAGERSGHYVPPIKFGLGGVTLGNEFEVITDEEGYKTLNAAWSAGVRYYDVSPWYGLGLAERRFGNYLHNKNRDEYIISSKVGKLLKASRQNNGKSNFPFSPSPNNVVFDYTADGVRRSVEDSLQRLGLSDLDIVFVHDISSDNKLLPTPWQQQFEIALRGAFPALARMKEEGIIKGWGIGVNTPEPILRVMQEADPDVCLLASQYSLIDHANALNNLFPVARRRNVKFVVGSSLNAGFISGSPRYNYGKNSWNIPRDRIEKRQKLRAVAAQYGVDLRTAALRFSAAPDVAAALIVGARSAEQILANVTSMQATVPSDFWAELKRQKLIEQNAPTPS